jgi:hypothetical protein
MNSDIENNLLDDEDTYEDPIYLLFKKWYIESIDNYFLHNKANTYNKILDNTFSISIIILSGLATLLSGLILILNELDIYIAVLVLTILILILNLITFVLSGVNKFLNFSKLRRKHKNSSIEFKELAEDILILFTPLSQEETEINMANERNFIQKKIKFFKDVSPSIPEFVKKTFIKSKNSEYKNYIRLFESIKIENNNLFNPVYNNIMNENIEINNDVLLNNSSNIPLLQQLYNEQKIY